MFEGRGWIENRRKEGLGEKKKGLIADFDPGTPSVSEHSQPQALHFNTPDIRTAKFTWVKNRERCLDKVCPHTEGVAARLCQVNESDNHCASICFRMSHPRDSLVASITSMATLQ